jgi:DNA invertase Pin-like site-specific DNA recombinase
MKTYAYFSFLEKINSRSIHEEIMSYCYKNSLNISKFLSSSLDLKKPIHDREILQLLNKELSNQDALVVYEAGNLGRSICQVIEVLKTALIRGVNIHFVKVGMVFYAKEYQSKTEVIHLLGYVSTAFSSRLTSDDLFRRDLTKKSLGRPKGRENNRLKLDEHQSDILKYLHLKISKRSIAKLVRCHPQTLQEWLVRRKVTERSAAASAKTTE